MIQAALEFACQMPKPGTQCCALLLVMKAGVKLTVASALSEYGCYALSQRMGELRRMGWPVQSEWVECAGGARVKRYFLK